MTGITIDRLSIDAAGLSAGEGERLARLVADKLGSAAVRLDRPLHVDMARVNVPAPDKGGNLDALAESIVYGLLRQIGANA